MDDIDEFVNVLFQLDFCLNFITAVEVNGRMDYHLGQIAICYLRSWFIIDLVACFPFNLILPLIGDSSTDQQLGQSNSLAKLAKLPRFYRLLRVVRLFRLLKFNRSLN